MPNRHTVRSLWWNCFTVLVCGSGVGVWGMQMLYDTEFGWRVAPDQVGQVLGTAPVILPRLGLELVCQPPHVSTWKQFSCLEIWRWSCLEMEQSVLGLGELLVSRAVGIKMMLRAPRVPTRCLCTFAPALCSFLLVLVFLCPSGHRGAAGLQGLQCIWG